MNDDREAADRPMYVHVSPVGDASYHKFRLPLVDVLRLWCRHWEVNAEIQLKRADSAERRPGKVLGVEGDMVWCKFDDCEEFLTLHANQIEPRDTPAESEQAPDADTPEPAPKPNSQPPKGDDDDVKF